MEIQAIFQDWLISFIEFFPKIIAAIIVFILTIVSSGFIAKWVKKIAKNKISNVEMLQLVFVVTRWTILILGVIYALSIVNFDITGFVAGLGIVGFTIGFALQDIARNFISGLLLLYRQPFHIGERVIVSDFTGEVMEINIRDTVIKTFDGELVIIPNTQVYENPIINLNHTRYRRRSVIIGLGYGEDADRAIGIFLEQIRSVPGVEADPKPLILADDLGDSTLRLSATFWVDQLENNILEVHSNVVKAIKSASDEYGIDLPYSIQTVRLERIEA
jgi:small-conductance mechanosensitive channel